MTGANEDRNHGILYKNVTAVREGLRETAAEARGEGNEQGAQAYLFWEDKLSEIKKGTTLKDLWSDVEFVYRQVTAMAVQAKRAEQSEVAMASLHSAHMLARLLMPQLSEDELQDQVFESLNRREAELDEG